MRLAVDLVTDDARPLRTLVVDDDPLVRRLIRDTLRPVRSDLTDREWEVLDVLSGGATNDDIARLLVLSTETVRSHLKNLYRKLGVASLAEAVDAAARLRELA